MKKKVLIVISAIIFVISAIVIVMMAWPDKKEVMAYEEKEEPVEVIDKDKDDEGKDIVIDEIYYYTDNPSKLPIVQESKEINGENYIFNGDMDVEIVETYHGIYLEKEEDLLYDKTPSETYLYESRATGKEYELGLLSSVRLNETKVERGISESMYYKEELETPNVDETIESIYHNGLKDEDEAAILEVVGVIKTKEYTKDMTINAVFECDDPNNEKWFLGEGREPVLLEDDLHPVWAGYEEDILDILNLNKDIYSISGGEWDGDYYEEINSEGTKVLKRKAIYYCIADVADYEVIYESKTEDLGYTWKEIYGINGDVDPLDAKDYYYMKASVHYEPVPNESPVSLYHDNLDVEGVIRVADSVLNHPFVKTEDEDEYIRLGLNKEYNSYGVPFMDNLSDVDRVNSNSIIYGHNISKSNVDVFGELSLYTDENYRDAHKFIEVDTENGKSIFNVIACMIINIKDDDDVAYSEYNNLEDDERRADFISFLNDRNMYDEEIQDLNGARYISLVTCYENYNDRLIVVGRCA